MNYEESIAEITHRIAAETDAASFGHTLFLTHGCRMDNAVVMYHGFTNCPRQYEKLAGMFFARGYNVYVPRVPHHGLSDLLTKEIGKLTLAELKDVCRTSVAIASGLGKKVTVLGLSMGGVMAAWNAQFTEGTETAFIIVPCFGWYFLPGMISPLIYLTRILPAGYLWWDPFKKDKRNAPYSMYHRFSSRGFGHILTMGKEVINSAKKKRPEAGRLVVMTNELDIAVDERSTMILLERWKEQGVKIDFYRFPRSMQMEHDIIDPLHPYEKTDEVYAKIFDLLGGID
jgi:esterase/lipase